MAVTRRARENNGAIGIIFLRLLYKECQMELIPEKSMASPGRHRYNKVHVERQRENLLLQKSTKESINSTSLNPKNKFNSFCRIFRKQ